MNTDIIPANAAPRHVPLWQQALADAFTDPKALLHALALPTVSVERQAAHSFALRVPQGFVSRMQKGDPHDPLLRQVLPTAAECVSVRGFVADPVGDHGAQKVPGLLHKYHGRALLMVTGACAVHCRYCFRRAFPHTELRVGTPAWQAVWDSLRNDDTITEVILSGGDPLVLSTEKLGALIGALEQLPQLQRLRIHSRVPMVLPERIDAALLQLFAQVKLRTVLVVHANHPHEIDETVRAALTQLAGTGVTLLNQSVLLRSVNDDVETLAVLSERLFAAHVMPYYLHQLDKVCGAAHFGVNDRVASGIMTQLRGRLPGYLVPKLVREIAGQPAKTPVGSSKGGNTCLTLRA